jgi:branched-subunit amino acid ABC-type transport system permease component
MTNEQILLTPGPTPIPPESLAEEAKPIIHHRTKEFSDLFNEFQSNLKYVFQTKEDVYIFASSGTGCMEAAVANLVSPGDKAIVSAGGVFGERWIKILTAFGANVVALRPSQWGVVIKPAEIEKALAENPDAARLMGISVDRMIQLTFMLGSSLAAVAGALFGLSYGSVNFHEGYLLGLKAFTAAVLGGIGSIPGAMLGGILLGVFEGLGAGYISSEWKDVFAFVLLGVILICKPSGIMGENIPEKV